MIRWKPPIAAALAMVLLASCNADGPAPEAGRAAKASTQTGPSVAAPSKVGMCAGCHGVQGLSPLPAHPHLAGQSREYLISAMRQYRSGERKHAAMQAVMGPLSESDIEALATYYAAQSRPMPE